MVKQLFHKVLSFLMAFVVLFSTMSFTIDMHYCGSTLVDVAIFKEVKTCGMEKEQAVSGCENPEMKKKSCCSDEQLIIEGQDDLKDNFSKLTLEQQNFVTAFTFSYISLFEGTENKEVPFVNYSPPFVKRNLQVLHQIFLI